MFYKKWAGSTLVPSVRWNLETGADTKCQAMEPMCQIMFYNQWLTSDPNHKQTLSPEVGRFHIDSLTDVELVHCCGHQVSCLVTDVSNHVL